MLVKGHGRQSKDKCMFLLYLDAVSVTNSRGPDITHMQFSTKVFTVYIQWNPSNPETSGTEESVYISEVSIFQR